MFWIWSIEWEIDYIQEQSAIGGFGTTANSEECITTIEYPILWVDWQQWYNIDSIFTEVGWIELPTTFSGLKDNQHAEQGQHIEDTIL